MKQVKYISDISDPQELNHDRKHKHKHSRWQERAH